MHGDRKPARRRYRAIGVAAAGVAAALVAGCASAGGSTATGTGGAPLQTIHLAASSATISVGFANYAIENTLGCFRKAGYTLDVKAYPGTSQGLLVAMRHGDADMAILGSDQFETLQDTIAKGGGNFPMVAFYESAYPFHWGLAVKPGSPIHSLNDLVGKTVGVDTLGNSSVPLATALLKAHGIDPNTVHFTATGVGAALGNALDSGKVDAMFTSDTTIGTVLQTGVALRFITDGAKPLYLDAAGIVAISPTKSLTANRKAKVFAECTSEGNVFVKANPVAAAYLMLKQFPTLTAPGQSLEQQLARLGFALKVRSRTLHSVDPTVPYGQMNSGEFVANLQDVLGKQTAGVDASRFYTNQFVPTLSDAQVASIQHSAATYQVPGLSAPLRLPALPANTP
ncbi:MAG TPA: ABC transporter substrate-binding protein [Pseudonocardiaceae bacterium]|nr:ABC transporter substrate-binding protein [Pseudonocardiaceae bacterium]